MSPCKILIVEDESIVAMDMSDMLTRLGYDVLPPVMSCEEAIAAMATGSPDLVLLDISLGNGKSGIEVARYINQTAKLPFIFVTSHSDKQTVAAAANTEPAGYLLKPFDADDLFTSIEVALTGFAARSGYGKKSEGGLPLHDSIFIKTDKNFIKVKIEDICCLESEHNYIFVHSLKGKFIVRSSFKEFLANISTGHFIQVHKSFMVNLDRVDHFSHTEITVNGKEIPLSRVYKDDFFARMHRMQ